MCRPDIFGSRNLDRGWFGGWFETLRIDLCIFFPLQIWKPEKCLVVKFVWNFFVYFWILSGLLYSLFFTLWNISTNFFWNDTRVIRCENPLNPKRGFQIWFENSESLQHCRWVSSKRPRLCDLYRVSATAHNLSHTYAPDAYDYIHGGIFW